MHIEVGTGLPHSVLPLELLFVATDFAIFPPISSGLLPNPAMILKKEWDMQQQ